MRPALPHLLLGCSLCAACAGAPGPRPLIHKPRVSAVGANGASTLRTWVQVDFQKIAAKKQDEKVEYLLQAVTFTAETPNGARSDRLTAAVVVGTVETPVLKADYPARVLLELIMFPTRFAGQTLRLRAKNVYERADDDPSYADLQVPPLEAIHGAPMRVERVTLTDAGGGKRRVEAFLDRDAPAVTEAWHVVDGKAYRMAKKGTRVFERSFSGGTEGTQLVFLDAGGAWLSPPYEPQEDGDDED